MALRRYALLWLALFGVYASTVGVRAFDRSDYGGTEPHYLLTAKSIVSDGDIDLLDEYRDRSYTRFYPGRLAPDGRLTSRRLHEPHAAGFALLISPAYALGGPVAVELEVAALAALAFVLAAALARRLVPEPWATGGTLACALSPPALAYGTAVYPEAAAAAALAGAALLALRVREHPSLRSAVAAGLLLGALPWLGLKYVLPAAVIGAALVRWLLGRRRGLPALVACELAFTSAVAYITFDGRTYGGLTPFAADRGGPATGADSLGDYIGRLPRLAGLWLDRDHGLLRWAPVFALSFAALWVLWRSRRERVARAVPERAEVEAAAGLLAAVAAAQVVAAAFLAPALAGPWFGPRQLVAVLPLAAPLAALGLRHAPRAGAALIALTLLASAWLYLDLRLGGGGWITTRSPAPWGPVRALWPRYTGHSLWASSVAIAAAAALAALVAREWRRVRRLASGSAPLGARSG